MGLKEQIATFLALTLSLTTFLIFFSLGCASKERISKPNYHDGLIKRSNRDKTNYLKKSKPYTIKGITYYPIGVAFGYDKKGLASWYGKKFHGRLTANGEIYNMYEISAAHKTLPFGTVVEITRLDTGQKLAARINDRGPFVHSRIIDLSYGAARKIDLVNQGTAMVRVVALATGKPDPLGGAPTVAGSLPNLEQGKFFIQVGAFAKTNNAMKVKTRLLKLSWLVRLLPIISDNDRFLTRVQVGPINSMTKAKKVLDRARSQGLVNSFIVAE